MVWDWLILVNESSSRMSVEAPVSIIILMRTPFTLIFTRGVFKFVVVS